MKKFDRIVMIGSTRLLYQCANVIRQAYPEIEPELLDTKPGKKLERYKENYNWKHLSKAEIMQFVRGLDEKVLVFSVMNSYIIPADILEKPNLTCVNLHHAMLPAHPGRNPEAWAIWEQSRGGGITWHYILPEVDAGDILIQKFLPITETETALSLYRRENVAALEALEEILPLKENQPCLKQDPANRGTLRYSYEAPNDGFLDLSWDAKTISRFLRAMNYGAPDFFMYMKVKWQGETYQFFKNRVSLVDAADNVSFDSEAMELVIQKDGTEFVLQDLKRVVDNRN